ncbi:MAG: helix-turn-helix domain-containing protein [Alphaproteobacteria bacterium]|nr:helix-turn-helix domain-containing protein [Alphaproteobacteria bacterium]
MPKIVFTIPEVIALIGVSQCVYVLVYISVRVEDFKRILLPFLYFLVLGCAFFVELGRAYIADLTPYYDAISLLVWLSGTPVSVLLIIQIAHITSLPKALDWLVLLFIPTAGVSAAFLAIINNPECRESLICDDFTLWLNISGFIVGALSLLSLWLHKNIFTDIQKQRAGKERYWLILALIIVNTCFLAVALLSSSVVINAQDLTLLRSILGLTFIYLVSTSLFRIYPQALFYNKHQKRDLSDEDEVYAKKIEDLLAYEKIYHEATYSRTDLARELGIPEAILSRIINKHFKKSFPQLLNEKRIEDAKQLLIETDASVRIICEEVGFNSIPSFNRVFKDMVGESPSQYRKNIVK